MRWEFRELIVPAGEYQAPLAALGLEGWQVAGVVAAPVQVGGLLSLAQPVPGLVFFLQRPLEGPEAPHGQ